MTMPYRDRHSERREIDIVGRVTLLEGDVDEIARTIERAVTTIKAEVEKGNKELR